jgi:hypothetical protein
MGYHKTGFVPVPRATRLLRAAIKILDVWSSDLDKEVAKAIKSLGKSDNIRLKNFFFERLLTIEHPKFDTDPRLKEAFLLILSDFLKETGYISISPIEVDYVTNPVADITEVIDLMLGTRMPKYSATDIAGDYATIDTLAHWLPEVIRRIAIVENERGSMIIRFYRWIMSIGKKLLRGEALAQHERTAYVMYCSRVQGTLGHYPGGTDAPLPALENSDVLVTEVGDLYKAVTLPGPMFNHVKMISDRIFERLTAYVGLHNPELKLCRGYIQTFGPYMVMDVKPVESIPWSLQDQMIGITSEAGYFAGMRQGKTGFSIRVPMLLHDQDSAGWIGTYPDDPGLKLILTNEEDISLFEMEFYSEWRQRSINSKVNGGTLELALTDVAFREETRGNCQVDHPTLEGFGLCTLTDTANTKLKPSDNNRIYTEFLLPNKDGGLVLKPIDMTALDVPYGTVLTLPAFSEHAKFPLNRFMDPAPQVVEFVASQHGLRNDERKKFETIIALYHNVAKYKRLTGKDKAPIDALQIAHALLGVKTAPTRLAK